MGSEKHNRAKCLDDCCHIGSREDSKKFYNTYKEVSEECGVRLAPSDDPDKCFGPSTAGTILGVLYNTEEWWWIVVQGKWTNIDIVIHCGTLHSIKILFPCVQDGREVSWYTWQHLMGRKEEE